MKSINFLVILLLVSLGCSKQGLQTSETQSYPASFFEPKTSDGTMITGKWDWVESAGGFAYREDNPVNTGNKLQIQFDANRTARYYKNAILQYTGTYSLATSTDPNTGKSVRTITQNYFGFYGQPEVEIMGVDDDTIIFKEPGADRFVHTYHRAGL